LDRLQLPESERASLAAEENEIADLRRKLEESNGQYSDLAADNLDLKQEVRDLQLEMEGNTHSFIFIYSSENSSQIATILNNRPCTVIYV